MISLQISDIGKQLVELWCYLQLINLLMMEPKLILPYLKETYYNKVVCRLFVIWSRGISRNSNMWLFWFSIWLKSSIENVFNILLKTLPESNHWFKSYSNWKILKTKENKRNAIPFLAVFDNQSFRLIQLDHNTFYCLSSNWFKFWWHYSMMYAL